MFSHIFFECLKDCRWVCVRVWGAERRGGGTQIEAHLLNALARGWKHRRAVVVVVVVVAVAVVLPLISCGKTVAALTPLSLSLSLSLSVARFIYIPSSMCVCGCACGGSKDNLWHNYYNVTMFRLSSRRLLSCLPLCGNFSARRHRLIYCLRCLARSLVVYSVK